jgi:YegS/Rv2252/BmrU family lipid kinase
MLRTQTIFEKPVFIVNPNSANGSTRKEWPNIEAVARECFPKLEVRFTTKPFEAPEHTARAIHAGADLIVSVGGDGTHNEVVNGFFEGGKVINPQAVLGVLSRGTGGDFRRTLGLLRCIGGEMVESVNQLAACRVAACDVGRLDFITHGGKPAMRHFINITSFGMGGEVDKRVNESSKALGGKASFLMGSIRAGLAYKNRRVKVAVDGQPFYEGPMYNIAVANGKYFGGSMMVAPRAEIDDGLFDVVACGDFTFFESLTLARTIYSGAHLSMPKVTATRGKIVEATSDEEVLLDVDGEAPGRLNARFENLAAAIRVLRM